jgi:integrase/recombinase XerD
VLDVSQGLQLADQATVVAHTPARRYDTDSQLIDLWLHGRSPHTRRAYRADVTRFLVFVAKPLPNVTLGDLQAFADSLEELAPSSRARTLAAIKSLLAFGQRTGYLPLNVGAALKLPTAKNTLAERILSETQVHRLLALEPNHRNQVLLRLLYVAGLRVSELAALKWRDLVARDDAGQVTVFGKGQKTRVVLLPVSVWRELDGLGRGPAEMPVFPSRRGGGHLHPTAVERIVWKAARRAGVEGKVSPHWLRHAHATHALERGAPIHLVQATLGHASVATTGRYLHARPTDRSDRYLAV